jgi:hypothetical protein
MLLLVEIQTRKQQVPDVTSEGRSYYIRRVGVGRHYRVAITVAAHLRTEIIEYGSQPRKISKRTDFIEIRLKLTANV